VGRAWRNQRPEPKDRARTQKFSPTPGDQSHAANVYRDDASKSTRDDSLFCGFFAANAALDGLAARG
jgi:hypothetical protein